MISLIAKFVSGTLLCGMGLYIAFLYVQEINKGGSPLMLVITVFMVGVSAFFFVSAVKSLRKPKIDPDLTNNDVGEGLEKVIQKNNAMDQQFGKTNDARNKLKMLELAGKAEEGS
jgi:hypothetical protein